jgi:hypothetical protein
VDVDEKRVAGLLNESCVFVVDATIFLSSVENGKRAWCTIRTFAILNQKTENKFKFTC